MVIKVLKDYFVNIVKSYKVGKKDTTIVKDVSFLNKNFQQNRNTQ